MPFIADSVFDAGLATIQSGGTRIDLCSSEPTTYAQATSTLTLANKTGLTTGAPQDGATNGRRVIVPAITSGAPGNVTGTGTVTHWALTNGSSTLYATGALTSSQAVTNGNTFTLDAISITIADAT
jgi:hypothetical protein